MFELSQDERLSAWSDFRKALTHRENPLESTAKFWANAPMIAHHHKVDPYDFKHWPTPWDIIVENRYDDFTLALMIGYTLKLSEPFKNHQIEVRTMVDYSKTKLYNLVFVNGIDILNYTPGEVVNTQDIDQTLYLENMVQVIFPR